jgi:hypothetical protein
MRVKNTIISKAGRAVSDYAKFVTISAIVVCLGLGIDARTNIARAVTLVDTGHDPSYLDPDGWAYWQISTGHRLGGQFSIASAYEITQIQLFMSTSNSSTVSIEIWSNSSNLPSTSLHSQAFSPANNSLAHWEVFSGLSWVLGPGTYWVELIGTSCGGGGVGNCGSWEGQAASPLPRYEQDGVILSPPNGNLSIRVFGDPAVVVTPLPATLPLFATGLGVMGLLGWRRKSKKAAAMAAA